MTEREEKRSEPEELGVGGSRAITAKTAQTVRNYAPGTRETRRRRPPACSASHPFFSSNTHTTSPVPSVPSPLCPSVQQWRGCGENGPGAYLNTFQLFRGSRSEIIETMVERLGSTGREGGGAAEKRSKEKAALKAVNSVCEWQRSLGCNPSWLFSG